MLSAPQYCGVSKYPAGYMIYYLKINIASP